MADDKPSLTAMIRASLTGLQDLSQLKDASKKKEFLDQLETETKASRASIEAIFSKAVRTVARDKGLNPDEYSKKKAPKFAPKLAATATVEPKATQAAAPTQKSGIKTQNPLMQATVPVPADLPLKHIAGSIDTLVSALVDNMEELTETEKEDAGACLQMALGSYLDTHEKIRMVFGFAGLVGIYGGRIKKARKITKTQKEAKEDEAKKKRLELEQAKPEFESKSKQFLQTLTDDV